jgi:hypothetical protein
MFTEFSSSAIPSPGLGQMAPLFPGGGNHLAWPLQVETLPGIIHVDLPFRMRLKGLPLNDLMEERR